MLRAEQWPVEIGERSVSERGKERKEKEDFEKRNIQIIQLKDLLLIIHYQGQGPWVGGREIIFQRQQHAATVSETTMWGNLYTLPLVPSPFI